MGQKSVVVVGGGISGLTAAYRLHHWAKRYRAPLSVTVIERERRWGGKIWTVREEGFIVEGGADAFVTFKPHAVSLCEELKRAQRLRPVNPHARRVFVLWRKKLHRLPEGFLTFTPDLKDIWKMSLLSFRGKARLLFGSFLPRPRWGSEVSIGVFFRYYLGPEATERCIAPLIAGVYGGDPEHLSVPATLPMVWRLFQESPNPILAMLGPRLPRPFSASRPPFMTLHDGLGELIDALLTHLFGVSLLRGRTVTKVLPAPKGFWVYLDDGGCFLTDAVLLAVPAWRAAGLLRPLDKDLATDLSTIPFSDAVTLSLSFDRYQIAHPLDGSGFLVAPDENDPSPLLGCTWTSVKFPFRAPEGKVLLRAFLRDGVDWGEDRLVKVVMEALRPLLGIRGEPQRIWVFRWRKAMPQYHIGHLERSRRIQGRLRGWRGLALAGNFLTGIGIPDCIRTGTEAAQKIWMDLFGQKPL